jgi:DNA-binding protein H-NS
VLNDRAKELKVCKVQQSGELVNATGADSLSPEELAGALTALETKDTTKREAWAKRGATFYEGRSRRPRQSQRPAQSSDRDTGSIQAQPGSPQSASGRTGAA